MATEQKVGTQVLFPPLLLRLAYRPADRLLPVELSG